MNQPYVPATFAFFFAVIFVHISFFLLYALEPSPSSSEHITDEKQRKVNGERRMIAIDIFIISSLCACGLVMHANLPLITYQGFFYKFDDGDLALEPFILSCFLNVYHHFLYPVQWRVIVIAWFLQLLLILYSWLPFVMTQRGSHFLSTLILILFYLSILAVNYRIHEGKIREFLFTESFSMDNLNTTITKPSSTSLAPLSNVDETKIISDYLAEMYSRTPSITTTEDVHDSSLIRSTVSSVTFASLDDASTAVSSVSISRVHHRQQQQVQQQQQQEEEEEEPDISLIDDTNTATSTITDGRTPASTLSERRKPHRSSLAKERSLY